MKDAQENNTLSWVFFIICLIVLCIFAWIVIRYQKTALEKEQITHRADLVETSKIMREDRAEYLTGLHELQMAMEKQSEIIDKQQVMIEASSKYMKESTHLLDGQLKAMNIKLDTLLMNDRKEG